MRTIALRLTMPALLLFSACSASDYNQNGDAQTPASEALHQDANQKPPLPEGDFRMEGDGARGSAYARGYAEIVPQPEPFCERDCKTYDTVVFHVMETDSDALRDYGRMMGQADGSLSFTLGCKEGGAIRYVNQAGMEMKEYTLSEVTLNSLLASSPERPTVLALYKDPIAGGRDAPACYSHFTSVGVVIFDNMPR